MKRYFTVEGPRREPITELVCETGAVSELISHLEHYSILQDVEDQDYFLYTWKDYSGSGELKIPYSVMFVLPEMLIVLNRCYGRYGLIAEARVYEKTLVSTLFEKGK